jgi:hypothetical protein
MVVIRRPWFDFMLKLASLKKISSLVKLKFGDFQVGIQFSSLN